MKYLALALLLCALPSLSTAACSRRLLALGQTHCQDIYDQTWHAVGSSWRNSKCQNCVCEECCDAFMTPVQFPDYCVSVFDPVACKYTVHMKDDPAAPCPSYASVGK